MAKEISQEDFERFEKAMILWMATINDTIKTMIEFQQNMGTAIELLANAQGFEFTLKEDARA